MTDAPIDTDSVEALAAELDSVFPTTWGRKMAATLRALLDAVVARDLRLRNLNQEVSRLNDRIDGQRRGLASAGKAFRRIARRPDDSAMVKAEAEEHIHRPTDDPTLMLQLEAAEDRYTALRVAAASHFAHEPWYAEDTAADLPLVFICGHCGGEQPEHNESCSWAEVATLLVEG